MADDEPTDTVGPWTIKSVANATRAAATAAARREGITVGQWLERRVNEWEAAGSPVHVPAGPPINLGELAHAMDAARALADAAKVAVPPQLAKDGLSLVRLAIRQSRGLPPPAPRKPKAAVAAAPPVIGSDWGLATDTGGDGVAGEPEGGGEGATRSAPLRRRSEAEGG